jgi:hypothetical protein
VPTEHRGTFSGGDDVKIMTMPSAVPAVRRKRTGWLGRLVAVAFGLGVITGVVPGATSATSNDPGSLVKRLDTMWSRGDTAGYASVYASNAIVTFYDSSALDGRAAIVQEMKSLHSCGYTIKRVAPIAIHGNYAATFQTAAGGCPGTATFLAVYQIQHGKIVRDWHLLPGTTPPLDKLAP